MVQEDIDEITIQGTIIQWKQKHEQLEIEYLLCNTSINAYVIEITKNLNQKIDKSTRERVHPYTNINHTHLDQNSKQLELWNIPLTEIN
jgi:hypothetical protein